MFTTQKRIDALEALVARYRIALISISQLAPVVLSIFILAILFHLLCLIFA